MKQKHKCILAGFFLALAFLWVIPCLWAADMKPRPDPVARVNGSTIALDMYERELFQIQKKALQQGKQISEAQLSEIRKRVLENIIGRELLYQESMKIGIVVKSGDVDAKFESMKTGFPNELEFQSSLAEMNLTEETLKIQIRRGMARQQFVDSQIAPKVTVTERETRSFYDKDPQNFLKSESVHARHILIKVLPAADETQKAAALEKIDAIQERLYAGEDFVSLARSYSEGPSSDNGGDLGYFGRGQMVKLFEDAAFALEPGQVSGIVQTEYGYHLIQILGKQPESIYTYDEAKDAIAQHLRQRQVQNEIQRYIDRLRANADVKQFLQ